MGNARQAALEKKASEAEDNFAVVAKILEEREATLRVKEAQLLEFLDHHRSLEGQTTAEMRELQLIAADLQQCFDTEEQECEKLAFTMEEMRSGVGLDFTTLINMPAFEETRCTCSNPDSSRLWKS